MNYQLTWSIEVEAENVEEAALFALQVQRDSNSIATHFHVVDPMGVHVEVDLLDHSLD